MSSSTQHPTTPAEIKLHYLLSSGIVSGLSREKDEDGIKLSYTILGESGHLIGKDLHDADNDLISIVSREIIPYENVRKFYQLVVSGDAHSVEVIKDSCEDFDELTLSFHHKNFKLMVSVKYDSESFVEGPEMDDKSAVPDSYEVLYKSAISALIKFGSYHGPWSGFLEAYARDGRVTDFCAIDDSIRGGRNGPYISFNFDGKCHKFNSPTHLGTTMTVLRKIVEDNIMSEEDHKIAAQIDILRRLAVVSHLEQKFGSVYEPALLVTCRRMGHPYRKHLERRFDYDHIHMIRASLNELINGVQSNYHITSLGKMIGNGAMSNVKFSRSRNGDWVVMKMIFTYLSINFEVCTTYHQKSANLQACLYADVFKTIEAFRNGSSRTEMRTKIAKAFQSGTIKGVNVKEVIESSRAIKTELVFICKERIYSESISGHACDSETVEKLYAMFRESLRSKKQKKMSLPSSSTPPIPQSSRFRFRISNPQDPEDPRIYIQLQSAAEGFAEGIYLIDNSDPEVLRPKLAEKGLWFLSGVYDVDVKSIAVAFSDVPRSWMSALFRLGREYDEDERYLFVVKSLDDISAPGVQAYLSALSMGMC